MFNLGFVTLDPRGTTITLALHHVQAIQWDVGGPLSNQKSIVTMRDEAQVVLGADAARELREILGKHLTWHYNEPLPPSLGEARLGDGGVGRG